MRGFTFKEFKRLLRNQTQPAAEVASTAPPVVASPLAPTPAEFNAAIDTDLDLNLVDWIAGATTTAEPTITLTIGTIGATSVSFAFESYAWPPKDVSGVTCDAIVCMFVKQSDGRWRGGKFDWIRKGGQTLKLLENIHSGYGGHVVPASGTDIAFMFIAVNGSRRSTAAFTKWP